VSDTSQEHLARRLDHLERENQRLKRLGALALIGLAALVIMGQATSAPVANTIEAERFILRDASGNARASLGVRPDGTAALALADDTHQERAVFTVTAQGLAAVELSERSGRLRAGLAVRPRQASVSSANEMLTLGHAVMNLAKASPTWTTHQIAQMTPDERAADAIELVRRARARLAEHAQTIEHEPAPEPEKED